MNKTDTNMNFFEQLYVDLIGSAGRVNSYAEKKDTLRNHVNYGRASHSADTLRHLGHNVTIHFWEDEEGFLMIEKILMNDKEVGF